MRNQIFALAPVVLTVSLLGAGCGQTNQPVENNQNQQATTTQQSVTSTEPGTSVTSTQGTITNEEPTSTASGQDQDFAQRTCDNALGSLININAPGLKWQACYFSDDSLCEIGSLERGECKAGACKETCLHKGEASEGWYDYCSGLLIREAKCSSVK
ncbi:MAG: hypothetical protein PHC70_00095 [Patescibacteria group bacterium]|nr:hypothetical protein [Patescibacteria group bacterium]